MLRTVNLMLAMTLLGITTAYAHPPEECRCQSESVKEPTESLGEVTGEIVVPFTQFRGEDVEFVYNAKFGRAELRVLTHNKMGDDSDLQFLVELVREIVATGGDPFPLADTGYMIEFRNGGHPSWGPTTSLTDDGEYQNLMFGERVELTDRTFIIYGQDTPPPYSWY